MLQQTVTPPFLICVYDESKGGFTSLASAGPGLWVMPFDSIEARDEWLQANGDRVKDPDERSPYKWTRVFD